MVSQTTLAGVEDLESEEAARTRLYAEWQTQDPVRENKVRRMAKRLGLMVKKSRTRNPDQLDYNSFWIIEPRRNLSLAGGQTGLRLVDAEQWLIEEKDSRRDQ